MRRKKIPASVRRRQWWVYRDMVGTLLCRDMDESELYLGTYTIRIRWFLYMAWDDRAVRQWLTSPCTPLRPVRLERLMGMMRWCLHHTWLNQDEQIMLVFDQMAALPPEDVAARLERVLSMLKTDCVDTKERTLLATTEEYFCEFVHEPWWPLVCTLSHNAQQRHLVLHDLEIRREVTLDSCYPLLSHLWSELVHYYLSRLQAKIAAGLAKAPRSTDEVVHGMQRMLRVGSVSLDITIMDFQSLEDEKSMEERL